MSIDNIYNIYKIKIVGYIDIRSSGNEGVSV